MGATSKEVGGHESPPKRCPPQDPTKIHDRKERKPRRQHMDRNRPKNTRIMMNKRASVSPSISSQSMVRHQALMQRLSTHQLKDTSLSVLLSSAEGRTAVGHTAVWPPTRSNFGRTDDPYLIEPFLYEKNNQKKKNTTATEAFPLGARTKQQQLILAPPVAIRSSRLLSSSDSKEA